MSALLAGAATADITPPVGGLMDGYGARREPSKGVHDPLFARALVLDQGEGRACAVVGSDLLGVHSWIAQQVREQTAARTGIAAGAVLVSATHNHAGPVGVRRGLYSWLDELLAADVAAKMAGAVAEAYAARRPASLKLGQATLDTVSQNRRHPDWPTDPVLRLLLVDGEDGRPVASLLNFACHATVLDATNLMLSAEFPGAACRLVQQETEAPCVYLNGACGNVNPTWVRQDFDSVERVGRIIGGQALRLIGELRTIGPGQRAANIRWDESTEKPVPGRAVEPDLRAARRQIELPLRQFAADEEYAAQLAELEPRAAALQPGSDERRETMARLTALRGDRWLARWLRQPGAPEVGSTEVQALLLGRGLGLLALPGEFFAETAQAVRDRCGLQDLLVACYANDYVGYVIPPEAYPQGGYEPGVTPFAPQAEGVIIDASVALLREAAAAGR